MRKSTKTLVLSLILLVVVSSFSIGVVATALDDDCNFWCRLVNIFTGKAIAGAAVIDGPSVPTCGKDHTEGMISYWQAEGDASDSHYENHGTIYGATFTTGKVGQAFSFDGINDYIQIADDESLHMESMTAELWLYVDSDPDCDANNLKRFGLSKAT